MRYVAVFFAVAFADWLWAQWMLAIADKREMLAGTYSAAIIVVGAFVTLSYVRDRRYLVPAALGAFVGTYISVWHG